MASEIKEWQVTSKLIEIQMIPEIKNLGRWCVKTEDIKYMF